MRCNCAACVRAERGEQDRRFWEQVAGFEIEPADGYDASDWRGLEVIYDYVRMAREEYDARGLDILAEHLRSLGDLPDELAPGTYTLKPGMWIRSDQGDVGYVRTPDGWVPESELDAYFGEDE